MKTTTETVSVQLDETAVQEAMTMYEAVSEAKDLELVNEKDYENAGALLVELSSHRKVLESKRDEVLKPLNAAVKKIREWYKPAFESLTRAEGTMRTLMLSYKRREAEAKELAAKKAQKLLKDGKTEKAMVLIEQVNEAPVAAQGVSTRKTWTLEVVDASKVPAEFWMIDERALREYAKANAWSNPPPGVKYVQVESLAVRS